MALPITGTTPSTRLMMGLVSGNHRRSQPAAQVVVRREKGAAQARATRMAVREGV